MKKIKPLLILLIIFSCSEPQSSSPEELAQGIFHSLKEKDSTAFVNFFAIKSDLDFYEANFPENVQAKKFPVTFKEDPKIKNNLLLKNVHLKQFAYLEIMELLPEEALDSVENFNHIYFISKRNNSLNEKNSHIQGEMILSFKNNGKNSVLNIGDIWLTDNGWVISNVTDLTFNGEDLFNDWHINF